MQSSSHRTTTTTTTTTCTRTRRLGRLGWLARLFCPVGASNDDHHDHHHHRDGLVPTHRRIGRLSSASPIRRHGKGSPCPSSHSSRLLVQKSIGHLGRSTLVLVVVQTAARPAAHDSRGRRERLYLHHALEISYRWQCAGR